MDTTPTDETTTDLSAEAVPEAVPSAASMPLEELVDESPEEELATEDEDTDLGSEYDKRYGVLRDEFGEQLTDLIVDAEFDEGVGAFLLEAEARLQECVASSHGRASFYLHREPGPKKDHYVLRTIRPTDFNANWVTMLSGQPEQFEKYEDEFLRASMLYPSYDEVDWGWDDSGKMHAPDAFTKGRLVAKYFEFTLPDPQAPSGVAFGSNEVEPATRVVKRKAKPSL